MLLDNQTNTWIVTPETSDGAIQCLTKPVICRKPQCSMPILSNSKNTIGSYYIVIGHFVHAQSHQEISVDDIALGIS